MTLIHICNLNDSYLLKDDSLEILKLRSTLLLCNISCKFRVWCEIKYYSTEAIWPLALLSKKPCDIGIRQHQPCPKNPGGNFFSNQTTPPVYYVLIRSIKLTKRGDKLRFTFFRGVSSSAWFGIPTWWKYKIIFNLNPNSSF